MMTASEYRAQAANLDKAADTQLGGVANLELKAMATQWRTLAVVADWQDAMIAALARYKELARCKD
jgi:hypothetical protein